MQLNKKAALELCNFKKKIWKTWVEEPVKGLNQLLFLLATSYVSIAKDLQFWPKIIKKKI